MAHEDRKHIWIDRFQTRLALRISAYLALFPLVLVNFLFAWKMIVEGVGNPLEQMLGVLRDYSPALACLLVLVPVMAWDTIRFSHRLVGPVMRFRRTVQDIARGESVRPIKLREGDYLDDFRDDFNQMLDALQRRGTAVLRPDVPREEEKTEQKLA